MAGYGHFAAMFAEQCRIERALPGELPPDVQVTQMW